MWPLLVAAIAIVAGMHAIDASPVGVFYDDAQYVILGRSIALGEGYRYLNVPGAPAATHFPPGYPALLALLWRISPSFPENIALFKMANAVLLGCVAAGAYWFARRRLAFNPQFAAIAALTGTVTIPALVLSSAVMSEVLFLALLLPWLVFAEDSVDRPKLQRAAWLGASAGVLCLIRTHALVLVPAIAFIYATRRAYREAGMAVIAAFVALMPWLWWVTHNDPLVPATLRGQYGSYGAWLADGIRANGAGILVQALRDNIVTSYAIVARSFSLGRTAVLDALAVLSVLALSVSGALAIRKRAPLALAFVVLYLGSVLVWPFSPLRFIWGIWPLFMLLLVSGALFLWNLSAVSQRRARVARVSAILASGVAIAGIVLFNVQGYRNSWWATVSRSYAPRIQTQLVWVTEKTSRDDVVVTDDEGAVYLYTGRRALPASEFTVAQYFRPRPAEENARHLARVITAFSPTYVVAWTKPTLDAAEVLVATPPRTLVQVDTIPTGRVYRYVGRANASP